jgi:DNA-binding PadR family transcriptional regulator
VLLGFIARQPESGYGLKRRFGDSPLGVYRPSPGALYPALRRLVSRGLLAVADQTPEKGRAHRLYRVTDEGRAVHLEWLRQPVDPDTVGNDLGLHMMRFAMMEQVIEPEHVTAFLEDLAGALDGFVSGMERYLASGAAPGTPHVTLAVEHGIAVHRASLEWARSAIKTLRGA